MTSLILHYHIKKEPFSLVENISEIEIGENIMRIVTFFLRSLCISVILASTGLSATLTFSTSIDPIAKISITVLREAYQQLGFEIIIRKYPAQRSLVESNSGNTDGEVNRINGINRHYPNLLQVISPINYLEGVIFSFQKKPFNGTLAQCRNCLIGIRRGTKFAEKATFGLRRTIVNTNSQLFKMLDLERINMVLTSRTEGLLELKKLNLPLVHILSPPVIKTDLYHYLHKKHKNLLPKISKVLSQMGKEGCIEAIRSEYLNNM